MKPWMIVMAALVAFDLGFILGAWWHSTTKEE